MPVTVRVVDARAAVSRGAHGAFTLIELLVVISIIGILAAMMLPAITLVRQSAERVTCGSQLRQVGMACISYAGDWHGTFPMQNPNPNFWSRANWGQGLAGVLDYFDSDGRILFCSGAFKESNTLYSFNKAKIQAKDWANCYHYGYCYYAGCVDTLGNWTDPPFAYGPAALGTLGAIKGNNMCLISTNKVMAASGKKGVVAKAVIAADAIYKFGIGTQWQTTAINHPSGGPLVAGKGGGNVVHGDGHVEWYAYPSDIIDGGNGWCNNVPWKAGFIP